MNYSQSNHIKIIEFNLGEWCTRSRSKLLRSKGKGCFVYHSETDRHLNSSGMFYTYDMIPNYFDGETAGRLQKMIQEANHEREIVVALFFEDRGTVGRLPKIENSEDTEV